MSYPPPPPPPGPGASFGPRPGQYPPGQYPPPGAPGQFPPQQLAVVQSLPTLRGRTPRRLGALFLIVGIIVMVIGGTLLETKALNKVDDFKRVEINHGTGNGSVHLDKGSYVAYYEAPDADDLDKDIPIPAIRLRSDSVAPFVLSDLYGGGKVKTGNVTLKDKLTYSHDGHDGIAIYTFHIDTSGEYQVEIVSQFAKDGSDVAFGEDIDTETTVGSLVVVLGVLLFIAGIVLLIVGFVKKRNHKKEIAQHGYLVALQPGQQPGQQPGYQAGQQPGYQPGYQPGQQPPPPNPGSMYDEQFKPPPPPQ